MNLPIICLPEKFLGLKLVPIRKNPDVILIKNILTPWECKYLIDLSKPKLESSTMIVDGKEVVNLKGRSSRSAFITKNGKLPGDPVIDRFLKKLSSLINIPISHFEGMKVVNYRKGEEYKVHRDFFGPDSDFIKKCGDRMFTFFIYLNDIDQGGATAFPDLGFKIKPETGSGVFWINIDHNNHYNHNTKHAGEPVLGDTEKWGINVWIRQNPYV